MKKPRSIRRILTTAAALVAVGALTFGATACTSATSSTPAPVAQAIAPAAAPAPAAAAPAASAAAAAAPAAASAGPTASQGKQVVQASCTGKCHGSELLKRRYSTAQAQAIAADMGRKAGLNSADQAAVVAYFAQ